MNKDSIKGDFSPVVNCVSLTSLLPIPSIHELPIIPIDFVLEFTLSDLEFDVVLNNLLVMLVDGNLCEYLIQLNKLLSSLKPACAYWVDILHTVI